jgi:hypothetical protein
MFLTWFSTKTKTYCNTEVSGQAIVQADVNVWFPHNCFSLLWLIDTKLGVWVAYTKSQIGIPTQVM